MLIMMNYLFSKLGPKNKQSVTDYSQCLILNKRGTKVLKEPLLAWTREPSSGDSW